MNVPDNKIVAIPFWQGDQTDLEECVVSFKGMKKRDWFAPHAYYCLPLTIGNQYGFGVKTLYDFTADWNGGERVGDLQIEINGPKDPNQHVNSHFGSGIITLQNRWVFRTPPKINLLTMDPPNIINDGLRNLTAVIETDNLRRDFTFNIKMTRPDRLFVPAGTIISAFIPIPRYFVENFELEDARNIFDHETLIPEWEIQNEFTRLRQGPDMEKPHNAGRLYYNGEDAYGNKYEDHQRTISKGKDL